MNFTNVKSINWVTYWVIISFIIWLCLTRTGNYQIREFDWLMDIDRGLDFPI